MNRPESSPSSDGSERPVEGGRPPLKGRRDREFFRARDTDAPKPPDPAPAPTPCEPSTAEPEPESHSTEPPETEKKARPAEGPPLGNPVSEPPKAPLVEELLHMARLMTSLAVTLDSLDGLLHRLRADGEPTAQLPSLMELLSRWSQNDNAQRPRGDVQSLLRQYLQR